MSVDTDREKQSVVGALRRVRCKKGEPYVSRPLLSEHLANAASDLALPTQSK